MPVQMQQGGIAAAGGRTDGAACGSTAGAVLGGATRTGPEDQAAEVYLTLAVAETMCGVPVLAVRDVLTTQAITRIPLAPPEVAGSLNLRGRIVTAVDLRRRLGLPPRVTETAGMSVVVERDGELYSLLVDQVGDVVPLPRTGRATKPPTLDPLWREVAADVHRLEDRLVILLDVERVLAIGA